jgi:hypothetical protein
LRGARARRRPGFEPGEQSAHGGVAVVQTKQDPLPRAAPADDPIAPESLQVARRAGLREPDHACDLRDAALGIAEDSDDAKARGIAKAGQQTSRRIIGKFHCMAMHTI